MWRNYDKWENIKPSNKHIIQEFYNFRLKVLKKSKSTADNEEQTLRKLAKYFKNKNLEELTDTDLQKAFSDNKFVNQKPKGKNTADLHATNIILFYQWIFKLHKKERPNNMLWYEFQKQSDKDKNSNPNRKEEQFITREEYDLLIEKSMHPQNKAMWETLYLSGARDGEILGMKNTDVLTLENGWEIVVNQSKTKPRHIALSETPGHLLYWIRNHPLKNQEEFPLWISRSNKTFGKPIKRSSAIVQRLTADLKKAGIEKNFTPHSFRRTRATIMFGEKYTDKEMALHFGWKIRSVPQRREEYDLTDYNDLREKVFKKSEKPHKYENVQAELERQDQKHQKERDKWEEERITFKQEMNTTKDELNILKTTVEDLKTLIIRNKYDDIDPFEGPKLTIKQREFEDKLEDEIIQEKDKRMKELLETDPRYENSEIFYLDRTYNKDGSIRTFGVPYFILKNKKDYKPTEIDELLSFIDDNKAFNYLSNLDDDELNELIENVKNAKNSKPLRKIARDSRRIQKN